ncbi:MAG: hypothetical protein ACRELB_21925, partial [Polyangiaceae bacterium]
MNAPFGWCIDDTGRLVPHPRERIVVSHALYYRARGYTLRGVVQALAGHGFVNRRGRQLGLTSVARLILRPEPEGVPPRRAPARATS